MQHYQKFNMIFQTRSMRRSHSIKECQVTPSRINQRKLRVTLTNYSWIYQFVIARRSETFASHKKTKPAIFARPFCLTV